MQIGIEKFRCGMYSVVLTDLVQFIILALMSIIIAAIAMMKISPDMLAAAIPEGYKSLAFGVRLNLDWSNLLPAVNDMKESQLTRLLCCRAGNISDFTT